MGNLGSVQNMLKHIGIPSQIVDDPCVLEKANKILLPGVGSFDQAMKHIQQKGFLRILNQKALTEKIPVLGICLGMQLLTNGSEEGILPGLGWIDAKTIRFPINNGLKVPHMGWNIVHTSFPNLLTKKLPEESRFYFVHSYYVKVVNEENSILKTDYGVRFDAAIQKNNIYGVQFHPEKSHKFGMQILKNFAEI